MLWGFCSAASVVLAGFRPVLYVFGTAGGMRYAIEISAVSVIVPRKRKIARRTKMRCAVLLSVGYRRNGRRRNADRNKTLALRFW